MIKLFCAIVGDGGSTFPVDIDAIKSVGDLKKAIKEEKKNDFKNVDADKLMLFLAKKGGAWLKLKDLLRMRNWEIPDEDESHYYSVPLHSSSFSKAARDLSILYGESSDWL
ncbi:hypothetical protein PC121_g17999 [Phytophthora cactorum]|nr:hypothetical protein PC120_g17458 [Phytophthora cactorum]KAG3051180.1 hypothetical protein PC121_g17999 [Phytophthora cactorum]KAG4054543.1 hypothetical protein PC123_g10352 [Phytophthora cactorum]